MLTVVLPSFELPVGMDRPTSDLLLRLAGGYPDIAPDMWWFALGQMLLLSGVFMLVTLGVFVLYGLFAATVRRHVISRPRLVTGIRRTFAVAFVALGARLALTER